MFILPKVFYRINTYRTQSKYPHGNTKRPDESKLSQERRTKLKSSHLLTHKTLQSCNNQSGICCCYHFSTARSHLTLCNPMDYIPPDSSIHWIFQARILQWVAISFSRGYTRLPLPTKCTRWSNSSTNIFVLISCLKQQRLECLTASLLASHMKVREKCQEKDATVLYFFSCHFSQ